MWCHIKRSLLVILIAFALWLNAETAIIVPLALSFCPSLLTATATCAIYSDNFSVDHIAADYTTLSGTFTVAAGEVSTTSATPLIVNNSVSTTGNGVASIDAKSSATGNTAKIVGSYNGSTYIYGELTFNGASSTWKIFESTGAQLGDTFLLTTSTATYYTIKICWSGGVVNGIVSVTSSTDCVAHIPATTGIGGGTKAGFGGTRSSGTLTYDNFSFNHGPNDMISGVDCDDCSQGVNTSTSDCFCTTCDPDWFGELDVSVSSMVNGTCTGCVNYDGLYRLPRNAAVCGGINGCCWFLPIPLHCGTTASLSYVRAILSLVGGNYIMNVQISEGTGIDLGLFIKIYGASEPDCSAWSGENIPFSGMSGALCTESGATVTITAVPV